MLSPIIRRLTLDDLDVFVNLRLESVQNSPESFMHTYPEEKDLGRNFSKHALSSNKHHAILGAFMADELIGVVGIYQKPLDKIKHKAYLWGTYVSPLFRRQGVAKSLVTEAIAYGQKEMQCSVVHLSFLINNIAAKNLYSILGFQIWGREVNAHKVQEQFYDEFHASLILA